jgi:hypothetical protein
MVSKDNLAIWVLLLPTALFMYVVRSSSSRTGASTYQSPFPAANQSARSCTYRSANPNPLGRFSLPCFRITSVSFVRIGRRRKSSNQHNRSKYQRYKAQPHDFVHDSLLLRTCNSVNANQSWTAVQYLIS